MNVKRRSGLMDSLPAGGSTTVRNAVSQRQQKGANNNKPQAIQNAVAMQPTNQGYARVRNARSGPK